MYIIKKLNIKSKANTRFTATCGKWYAEALDGKVLICQGSGNTKEDAIRSVNGKLRLMKSEGKISF
jgi:hypothetical protein